ncbi:MAG: phosphodiester glycosidase family protein [Lachnospiraceae bacterium]|nr:phosphodiester glycosidase family protein [Lachnospiraceae bacterium]
MGYFLKAAFASIGEMDYVHLLLATSLPLLLVAMLIKLLGVRKKQHPGRAWAALSCMCMIALFFFCVVASSSGTLVFMPADTPEHTSLVYLEACVELDGDTAVALQSQPEPIFTIPDDEDKTAALYYDALKSSYSYTFDGPCVMEGTHASQSLHFSYLDLNLLPPEISPYVNRELEVLVENSKRADVFDDQDNYRTDVLEKLYEDGIKDVLKHADSYYSTAELTLELDYVGDRWEIVPNDALNLCLAGGSSSGATYANNARSEVLGGLTYIPKIYTIAENATVVPAPNPSKFGHTDDVNDIIKIAGENPRLIDGKELILKADTPILNGGVSYYLDDTIFCYCWKEMCDGHSCTFAEVFVADGSQFRRKFSQDTFGSPVQKPGTQLSTDAGAVIAMNGDFYKFRAEGMTVYQRQLYRFRPAGLEMCHIDTNGDLLFTYAGELKDEAEAEKYVADHDVLFTLAFGPVLIEDGKPHDFSNSYLLGQVAERYSRSAICQAGEHHYLLMTLNHGNGGTTANMKQTQELLLAKGVDKAYALDGGQTAEIILDNKVMNHIDYGTERTVSDIIFFATALPEDENR